MNLKIALPYILLAGTLVFFAQYLKEVVQYPRLQEQNVCYEYTPTAMTFDSTVITNTCEGTYSFEVIVQYLNRNHQRHDKTYTTDCLKQNETFTIPAYEISIVRQVTQVEC
ncbi:transmembrane protein, putative (macronuclear) [Tetrahymena thermophila SB210]|uniref:Transmembrane protein, putative n=1 Tax=Tetrahymena thermophila (strain SB210) TaxID=312017 RepID=Q22EB1_TETTS|nr:transmembrane protein, putative [Tetrahymena thermophila SB210]EAR83617.1 transmembrane protein, putative [Tetrahymena thermophila SB210]|eukprot:XP_001031280.1 transmembrane protein, putative [Tetrahymena thermophila SB210]